jgi:hypothetical protein
MAVEPFDLRAHNGMNYKPFGFYSSNVHSVRFWNGAVIRCQGLSKMEHWNTRLVWYLDPHLLISLLTMVHNTFNSVLYSQLKSCISFKIVGQNW